MAWLSTEGGTGVEFLVVVDQQSSLLMFCNSTNRKQASLLGRMEEEPRLQIK